MRNQDHYANMGIEVHAMCKANMSPEAYLGAMRWSIEKYNWREKGSLVEDYQKIQVYAKWVELAHREDIIDEDKAVFDLIKQIPNEKYLAIYTTGRGGLHVAARVAYALNIPRVHVDMEPEADDRYVLWVDDIADTGATLKGSKYDTAVLCKRYNCPIEPTYCGMVVESDAYIKFKFQGDN